MDVQIVKYLTYVFHNCSINLALLKVLLWTMHYVANIIHVLSVQNHNTTSHIIILQLYAYRFWKYGIGYNKINMLHIKEGNRRTISQRLVSILFIQFWHESVIKWKHLTRYWPFVQGIHRTPVNSPHEGQCRGALMFSLFNQRLGKQLWG